MDYIFLIYSDEAAMAAEPAERAQIMAAHWAVMDDAAARGVFKTASPLQRASAAVTVRSGSGQPVFTDGPFAETKEALGGYYILDCADLDDAKAWAGRLAKIRRGLIVELRPLAPVPARGDA